MATKKTTGKPKARKAKALRKRPSPSGGKDRLYTLEVFLISGPITEKFAKRNPVVSRTIQMRGEQTLEDLHEAIFTAFDRFDAHMYEFQFGKRPMDPDAPRYGPAGAVESDGGYTASAEETAIDSLGLRVGQPFGYWFDFGDDWWHQINVEAIDHAAPPGRYPKLTKRVGKSPPQYADLDE